jgi:hypothetical protein
MNCGTLWYVTIHKLKKKEREWIEQMVGAIAKCAYEDRPEKDWPDWITEWVDDLPDQRPDVRIEGKKVHFASDGDTGEDLMLHVCIIRKFLERFRRDQAVVLEYSNYTSRGAEFGGGVYVITWDKGSHMTTWDWARDELERLGFGPPEAP